MRYLYLSVLPLLFAACHTEMTSNELSIPQIPPLAGSEWGDEAMPDTFIAFKSDGRAIGSGGCNAFFADYTFTSSQADGVGMLKFGPVGSTKKMCNPGVMEGERALFMTLSQTGGVEFSHLNLMLTAKDGTPLLTLQRRDWD